MKLVDLTHDLSETSSVWPTKRSLSRHVCCNYENDAKVIDIHLCSGIGTHMDAPNHFFKHGRTIDQISMEQCCGKTCVLHLSGKVKENADYAISKADIEEWEAKFGKIPPESIVLAHTGWDKYWNTETFCKVDEHQGYHAPGFSKEAAELLLDRKIKLLGIDTVSLDTCFSKEAVVHKLLLGNDIVFVECLANLSKLPPTGAITYLLPTKIKEAPEAPVRAIGLMDL